MIVISKFQVLGNNWRNVFKILERYVTGLRKKVFLTQKMGEITSPDLGLIYELKIHLEKKIHLKWNKAA